MDGRIIPIVVIALCLILPGCMTYQGLFGIEATDLSSLHPGMDRAEVEGVLGSPEETDQWQQGAKVHYDSGLAAVGYCVLGESIVGCEDPYAIGIVGYCA